MQPVTHQLFILLVGACLGWAARKWCGIDDWIAGYRYGVKTERQKNEP